MSQGITTNSIKLGSDTVTASAGSLLVNGNAIVSRNRLVVGLTDAATVTPNVDTTDLGILVSLSQDTTFANPSGTPSDGQRLELRIKSTASRALTFGSQYRSGVDIVLPIATTGNSKTDRYVFEYNNADTKWDIVGISTGY